MINVVELVDMHRLDHLRVGTDMTTRIKAMDMAETKVEPKAATVEVM
jgi:hypothetical protein